MGILLHVADIVIWTGGQINDMIGEEGDDDNMFTCDGNRRREHNWGWLLNKAKDGKHAAGT